MRFHPADFFQRDFPFGQSWVFEELRELLVRDCLNLRIHKRSGFPDPREKILKLANPREVIRIRAVLSQLKRGVMKEAFDFKIERFLEVEASGEGRGGFAEPTPPIHDSRISPLEPAEIICPFVDISEQMRQVPFIGVREISTGEDSGSGHCDSAGAAVYERRPAFNVRIAGGRAMSRIALRSSPTPGGIRCHG